jgi:hypothetical protein
VCYGNTRDIKRKIDAVKKNSQSPKHDMVAAAKLVCSAEHGKIPSERNQVNEVISFAVGVEDDGSFEL